MRIRSLVTSAALFGTLMASSALVSEALAQKGTVMSPSTSWAVTKVENGAGPYCAMARKFNQSTVLTIARNDRSETSFALDFQRPVLRTQGTVKVILDPGAGQQRAYEINPVSSNAFVVRLGRDASFFDAIERTGLLRVEAGGQSYHFNVADIEAGEYKLDACVANMVMPAAGEEMALTPEPGVDAEAAVAQSGKSFRREINALRRQISSLQDQNKALKVQMESRGQGAEEASGSVAKLSSELGRLQDENAVLKKELEAARKPSAAPVAEASLNVADNAELEELRQENLRLKAELQTVQPQDDLVAELQSEIKALQTKNESLQAAVETQGQGEKLVAGLQAQIRELEAQNASLNEQIFAAREDMGQDYEQQIAALSAENAELKSNMDKKGVDAGLLEQLRQQIAQAENENRLLQETAAQAQKDLEHQLREENLAALEKAQEDARAQQADVVAELRQELEGLRAQKSGDAEQAQRLADLQLELEALKAENSKKAEQLIEVGSETSNLQVLQEENKVLVEKLAAVETERAQAESMLKRIETLENENQSLQEELANAGTMPASASDGGAMEALKAENEELKVALDEAKTAAEQVASLEEQVATLQTANAELSAKAENSSVQADLDAALSVNEELRSQIESKDQQIVELETLREQLEALKTEQMAQAEDAAENDELESRIAELEKQRDEMKQALRDVVAVAEGYKQDNEDQAQNLAQLEQEISSLKLELASAQEIEPKEVAQAPAEVEQEREPVKKEAAVQPPAKKQEEVKQARAVDIPTPDRKPESPIREVAASEEGAVELAVVEKALEEPVQAQAAESPSLTRLIELEKEMRDTDPDDPKMQGLAQEYMALKARIERMDDIQQAAAAQSVVAAEPSSSPEEDVDVVALVDEAIQADDPYIVPVNEAQKLEQAMKQMPEPVEEPVEQVEAEVIEFTEPEEVEESITMSASADPFTDMAVENEGGQSLQEEAVELSAPVPQASAPQSSQPSSQAFSVTELITAASVSTPDKIKKVDSDKGDFDTAYQWNGGSIYGSAEQRTIASPAEFDELVKDYLQRTESRCPGEFAIVPDGSVDSGSMRADSYEVACVGGSVSSGASLLFFNQGGTFTVVAHEAPAEELDTAMDYRNQVKRVVTGI